MVATIKASNIRQFTKVQIMDKPQEQESFTQTPNAFFDKLLEEIDTLSELKVTLVLIRKICGWIEFKDGVPVRKEGDEVSFSQFVEMTGLSRPMVKQGIDAALARGSITRVAKGLSFYYQLNLSNYQGQGYESKRDAQLAQARAKRFSNTTGLATKPDSGVDTKPETGLATKHTIEIELNKKEIKDMAVSSEPGPTTIDLPDVLEPKEITQVLLPTVEAVEPDPVAPNQQDQAGVSEGTSHIPHSDNKAKKPRKNKTPKSESPYTKDPRLLTWKGIAEDNEYNYWPNRELQKMVYDHIPPEMLPRWEFTIRDWLKHSHKIQNISGMVKVFWFGWDDFYSGKADKRTLPIVNQVQERELAHAST